MTPLEQDRINQKYSTFYLSRFSDRTKRFVNIGKPLPTIQAALDKANKSDAKNGTFTFVDTAAPSVLDRGRWRG